MDLFTTSEAFDLFLIEIMAKGLLLLAVSAVLSAILWRASAAVRHGVWSLAFLGLLLLPLGAAFLPGVEVPVAIIGTATSVHEPGVQGGAAWAPGAESKAMVGRPDLEEKHGSAAVAPEVKSNAGLPALANGFTWTRIVAVLWLGGVLALLIRMGLIMLGLSYIGRRAEPVTGETWADLNEQVMAELGVSREVRLLRHPQVVVPMTYGLRRPIILLPAEADAWPEEHKYVTLLHEMLHVKRFDYPVHLVAQIARAFHWFNPLAWYASRRLLVERERACDDGVLSMGVASSSYADHLLGMARSILTGREASQAALAMARPTELRGRIVAILNPRQRRQALSHLRAVAMAVCALALVLPLAAMQPGSAVEANRAETNIAAEVSKAPKKADPQELTVAVDPFEDEAQEPEQDAGWSEEGEWGEKGEWGEEAEDEPLVIVNERHDEVSQDTLDFQKKAIHALSQLPDEQSVPLLMDIARTHRSAEIRKEAIFWLGQKGGEQVTGALAEFAVNDPSAEIQKQAIFALSQQPDRSGVESLISLARTHPNDELRGEAIFWLGQSGDPRAAQILLEIIQAP